MRIADHLVAAVAVLAAGAAFAQDAGSEGTAPSPETAAPEAPASPETPEAEAPDTPETPDAPAADDAAEAGPQEGEVYIAEEFGDWDFSCVRTATGNDPCRFTQDLENGEGGRVAQVSVVPLPPGAPVVAAAVIETPLGTLLRVPRNADELDQPGGLRMQVDGGELRVFQYSFCNAGGCVAEIGMEQELVDAFKRGRVATITIWSADAPGQPVELPLSLSGFTAGYDRVQALAASGNAPAE